MPSPETELVYKTDFQLAVAVILSAQCTDKRVNLITPAFFETFPNFESLSLSSENDVFQLIRSCSYPNNKTIHLIGLAQAVVQNFNGKLPADTKTLMTLPGIGRKTAHVLMSVLHDESVLAVDTHVFRVSKRIGLAGKRATTPLAVEKMVTELLKDKTVLSKLHHWLILHGRYVCVARKPKCQICGIYNFCSYKEKTVRIGEA